MSLKFKNIFQIPILVASTLLVWSSQARSEENGVALFDSSGATGQQTNSHYVGKFGYINTVGQWAIEPSYEFALNFSEGLAAAAEPAAKVGFIDKNGTYRVSPQFDAALSFSEGLAAVKSGNKWGYIDKAGKYRISSHFDNALPFSEGLAAVEIGKKWGFIDKQGNLRIKPQFADLSHSYITLEDTIYFSMFSDGLAAVPFGDKWGFIDRTGKVVIKPQFSEVMPFSEGVAVVHGQYATRTFISKSGAPAFREVFSDRMPADQFSSFSEGIAPVITPPNQVDSLAFIGEYVDHEGKVVLSSKSWATVRPFSEGLAAVAFVVETQWFASSSEMAKELSTELDDFERPIGGSGRSADGRCFRQRIAYGFINKHGDWVVKPQFAHVGRFHDGLVSYSVGRYTGFLNREGRTVIPPKFPIARSFSEGLAVAGNGSLVEGTELAPNGIKQ